MTILTDLQIGHRDIQRSFRKGACRKQERAAPFVPDGRKPKTVPGGEGPVILVMRRHYRSLGSGDAQWSERWRARRQPR
jgi:hypothetical protein